MNSYEEIASKVIDVKNAIIDHVDSISSKPSFLDSILNKLKEYKGTLEKADKPNKKNPMYTNEEITKLKALVEPWLNRQKSDLQADLSPEKNPHLYTKAAVDQARKEHLEAYTNDLHAFQNADKFKSMDPVERGKSLREFETKWHIDNNYQDKLKNVVRAHNEAKQDATGKREQELKEQKVNIATAGYNPDVETQSSEAGLQHVGGSRDQETGGVAGASIEAGSGKSFASKFPNYANKLTQERMQAAKPKPAAAAPTENKVIVRRAADMIKQHGSSDQKDRFNRVNTGRAAFNIDKPTGEKK